MIVVDASVLADFLLGRAEAIGAVVHALGGDDGQRLHAPEIVEPETINALRRLVLSGRLTEDRGAEAVADLGAVRLVRHPHAPLRERVWQLRQELTAYGEPQAWFGLGDRDLGTHLVRTARLREGRTLTEVTAELCRRWEIGVTLLPMTDAEVETHVATTVDGRDEVVHFQEYWIRHRAEVPVRGVELPGEEAP